MLLLLLRLGFNGFWSWGLLCSWASACVLLRMLLLGLAFMIGCHLWFLCLLIDSLRIIAAAAAGAFAAAAATCRAVAALACIPGFLFFGFSGLRHCSSSRHFRCPVWRLLPLDFPTSRRNIRRQSLQGLVRLKGPAKNAKILNQTLQKRNDIQHIWCLWDPFPSTKGSLGIMSECGTESQGIGC